MLDGGVEILLRSGGLGCALFGAENAAAHSARLLLLARQPPGLPDGGSDQRERHQRNQDRGNLLGRRKRLERRRHLGRIEMKSKAREHNGCGKPKRPPQSIESATEQLF
jgi:hypothetical protein